MNDLSSIHTTDEPVAFTAKDLVTDQDVRWCPGCGDYSILKQVQTVLPELGLKREEIVFISLENKNNSYDIIEGKDIYCNLNKENSNLIQ
jgi:pyruvate/2-oxoacid:ferredoxin oxidoreductase beta subunit